MIYWAIGYVAIGLAIFLAMRRWPDIFGPASMGVALLVVTTWPLGLVVFLNVLAEKVERNARR